MTLGFLDQRLNITACAAAVAGLAVVRQFLKCQSLSDEVTAIRCLAQPLMSVTAKFVIV
jgi:hypothetical protein